MALLTAESVRSLLRYEDGRLFWIASPARSVKAGAEAGYKATIHGANYWTIRIHGHMHRRSHLVFLMHYDVTPLTIRYLNGDTLDDRIENLTIFADANICEGVATMLKKLSN